MALRLWIHLLVLAGIKNFVLMSGMTSDYEIKKGLIGGFTVTYQCPQCSAGLKSSLDKAGEQDACPDCGAQFDVPGVAERNRISQEQADARRLKQSAAEAAQEEAKRREADMRAAEQRASLAASRIMKESLPSSQSYESSKFRQIYEYRMVQIPPTIVVEQAKGNEAASYLESTVNQHARHGWEFHRIDGFSVHQNPGCFLIFSGVQKVTMNYQVITFRRRLDGTA